MRASGRYSSVEMGKGSGYVAIEKNPARHKPEEKEAARILKYYFNLCFVPFRSYRTYLSARFGDF